MSNSSVAVRPPSGPHATIARYGEAWCEPIEGTRFILLQSCYEQSATYIDPQEKFGSLQELSSYLGGLHQRFPGCRLVQEGEGDAFDSFGRFRWRWILGNATVRRREIDFVRFAPSKRLQEVVAFLTPFEFVRPEAQWMSAWRITPCS